MQGKIIKALSGFYYVYAEGQVVECRARGIFRKTGESPLVGDDVSFTREGSRGTVTGILPRRNSLVRPAVANIDALVILASRALPVTEPFLIDRVTALAAWRGIESIVCFNKSDLADAESMAELYRRCGYTAFCASAETGEGVELLRAAIRGKTVAFTGNSGVGKSSLLIRLCPSLQLETAEISEKLGRGRHTTRHIELFAIGGDSYVADTPGFSSFDLEQMESIPKTELEGVFPEFAPYLGRCRFQDCSHRSEPDCAVLAALREGAIAPSRHASYVRLYDAAARIKPWEKKKEMP